ncbi:calcium channel protein [Paramarasmius palmivorus]|uniref:Calcium-channel protein CCH1 n=1 Tax=Paramarasmius palmivorus TaxID=297713 RepID=A0AAW0D7A0_9AGAR
MSLHKSGGLSRNSSSSSAIDLTGTPAGIASAPPSPSLDPSDTTISRRRSTSRGRDGSGSDFGQDPLRLGDLPRFELTQQARQQQSQRAVNQTNSSDDPFDSPTDERFRYHTQQARPRYVSDSTTYSTTHSGPSTTSLLAGVGNNSDEMEGQREDDEARLTTNMSRNPTEQAWSAGVDMEQSAGASPRSRRRTRIQLEIICDGMSLRVVNLRGAGLENQIRLADDDDDEKGVRREEEPASRPVFGRDVPLRGRTICCLGPNSRIRLALYNLLIHPVTEPLILVLIIVNAVVLTIQGAQSLTLADEDAEPPRLKGYFHSWEDYVLFALFIVFTIEAFARICVSGFLFDPDIPASTFFTAPLSSHPDMPVMVATQSTTPTSSNLARQASLTQGTGGPLSRFNETFKRPWQLPYSTEVTSGTSTPANNTSAPSSSLTSLSSSQPKNLVQEKFMNAHNILRDPSQPTFLSSMLRSDRKNPNDTLALPFRLSLRQITHKTTRNLPYLRQSWSRIDFVAILSFWVTFALATSGLERGSQHIGIFRAMSVIRTSRLLTITSGTTTIMHSLKTARPLLTRRSCYLLAVNGEEEIQLEQFCGGYINSTSLESVSFLMSDGEVSPSEPKGYICPLGQICKENDVNPNSNVESFDTIYYAAFQMIVAASANGHLYRMTLMMSGPPIVSNVPTKRTASSLSTPTQSPFGFSLALTSLVLQATRTSEVSETHSQLMSWGELVITLLFDLEIAWRIVASLPDWRGFFRHGHNILDLVLAIGSSVIQLPWVKNSMVYPWFTIFQLARFYRVILVVPRMKPLMLTVFGNMYGLVNMSLFLILVNYIAALVAIQLIRGDMSSDINMNFGEIFNSFLGDWSMTPAEAETPLGQSAIVVIFFAGWLFFAYFIVMQMFIAVINENFQVAEEHKKSRQASQYWAAHRVQSGKSTWMKRMNPYRWVRPNPVKVKVENLPSNLVLPMQKLSFKIMVDRQDWMEARIRELLASVNPETANRADIDDAIYERRAQKADFIRDHPTYDKTFWIFSQKSTARRLCQKVVAPANGPRIFGAPQSPVAHPIFQMIIFLAVVGGIVTEIIATPFYRRNFFMENGLGRDAWFDIAETVFGLTLLLEFLIKIGADGFLFTPNAYIKSIWNVIDFIILVGLLINVTTGLIFIGGLSRLTRSLKALRVLRLITLFDRMRNSFQTLIISGASRIMDAAILAILYMIPYAVWGLNIFAGQMNQCNDEGVQDSSECVGEYITSVVGDDKFGFPVPRAWDNPSPSTTFSFDSFKSSLLILFEIVSLEGWIDVMNTATSIVGRNDQPQTNVSEWNALFFLIYHLVGGVVILTLFISIIIGNFSSRTGTAFLTQAQREWIDLKKLFQRQRPSKRPQRKPTGFRGWCFDRAVHKHGWWSRGMSFLFGLHVIVLMTQTYTTQKVADTLRNDFFLAITFIYIVDVLVRLTGLGWNSFRANGWNLFDVIVTTGSFVTTFIARFGTSGFVASQLQKLFLVSIAFKLVQRSNSLNKLFKTAIASLPTILSLLLLWLILFGFFAILKVEVFGLTKWGGAENHNQNYAAVSNALVMLSFMSTGEGWNEFIAVVYPRCTNTSGTDSESDCGSIGWSFTLFIAWNILSMYIFVNLFTGVVVESFSYVFQSTGGAKSITREQMRSFKKIWAEYANPKTEHLERQNFVPFFGKLSGVFEVRIYPTEWSIPNIVAACKDTSNTEPSWMRPRVVDGVDLDKLERALNSIDYTAIRKRRALYCRLYHEATIAHQPGKGISFTDMLMLLAHHKLIVDHEALILNDLVVRTETNKLVTDLVNLDRVHSLLKTISYRRRFLAHLEQKRTSRFEQSQDIPAIVIDSMPGSPQSTRDISSVYDSAPSSPTPERRQHRPDMSPLSLDRMSLGSPGSALQRSSRRGSDLSMLSTDLGYRYPRDSMSEDDPQLVLSSMQNSLWGDMMSEAMKEEEKR